MHFISSNLQIEVADKQKILETLDLNARAQLIFKYMQSEMQMLELKNQIQSKVRTDIEKQQRDYFLNQQLKQIQEELGGAPNDAEVNRYLAKAKEKSGRSRQPMSLKRKLKNCSASIQMQRNTV